MKKSKVGILGAGLSGISLAYFLQNSEKIGQIEILEKECETGGLCRSFKFNGINYDIGPHILFSKDKDILKFIIDLLGNNVHQLKRSNRILYKGRFVKYPFENDLSALPEKDKMYCLNAFLNNPYENYKAKNMLQFFLKTFGEGITNCFLTPYNKKIWKFDPAFMDTQMVDRIPKPPKEDIIKSAEGIPTEGYLHQLFFNYPKAGGIASLIKAFVDKLNTKVKIICDYSVNHVSKNNNKWLVKDTSGEERKYDLIISTIPIQELNRAMSDTLPYYIKTAVDGLKYNSIVICTLNVIKANLGDNFAITIPDEEIIFHRVSNLDFLGYNHTSYNKSTNLLVEITYRKGDLVDKMTNNEIKHRVVEDLYKLRLINNRNNCISFEIRRFEYAYVIYDLNHRKNMLTIRAFYEKQLRIHLCGRFGEFEYLNMDAIIKNSMEKSNVILGKETI